jgi:hypothetical protein
VALVDCKVSFFDLRLGFGVSTGVGFQDDSFSIKKFGCGFTIGRKISVSIFDNEFGIDFKRIFTEEQWGEHSLNIKNSFCCPHCHF